MNVEISNEEIQVLHTYLKKIEAGDYRHHFMSRNYPAEETDEAFPTMRKLLLYGRDTLGNGQHNYAYMYENTAGNNYDALRNLASQQKAIFTDLIGKYITELKAEERDNILKLKIIDMTGYQFEKLLKYLRVIPQ